MIVRQVAVVTDRNMAVSGILPRIVMALHHMTIRARRRRIAQIAPALAVTEGKHANAGKDAEHRRKRNE